MDWTIRCLHEAQLHERNSFITLTYGRGQLPPHGSLRHEDFQLFLKRLRKRTPSGVRYYMCGEYGPLNQRPHYHANLFGVDFREDWKPQGKSKSGQIFYTSKTLEQLWGLGNVSVQPLTPQTAAYTAQYIASKLTGDAGKHAYTVTDPETGEVFHKDPPYAAMSLKPGLGADWYERHAHDVHRHDYCIIDGQKRAPPRFYDILLKRRPDLDPDRIEHERQKRAAQAAPDNTPERLAVREAVHEARNRNKLRELT
uniref:Putative replication protein VP4 n=1 Tax=uncultured virus TaxID=340016 RepID=A0A1D8MK69_9VIRU|nr:putative replication protein VP4 [uncultured virus]